MTLTIRRRIRMRIHSDILTAADFYAAIDDDGDVFIDELRETPGRKCQRTFIVYLEAKPSKGRRARHNRPGLSATYDEHGFWMAELYRIDPDAFVAGYKGYDDFHKQTKGVFA